ncbi:right-handed parallel beta-helix repeat-containing protein, partial [Candidatus Micrarchaeota archaeon]|nr:right-handed parallel beta-helix repeat-containing protein [Candidatus Micrarchaeota archaeon]
MPRSHLYLSLIFVIAALVLLPSVQAAATNVTACQVINVAGMYQFNQTVNGSSNACIDISASDVDLDCRGNLLFGNLTGASIGIRVGPANNVTVYDCRILNFSQGITVRTSSNVSIWNNSLWNNTGSGILLENQGGGHGNSTHVYNNTVSYSEYNIKSAEFDDSEFYNNRIYNASAYALLLQSGTRNNVTNNTIWNNTGFGIRTDTNENVTYLFNNTFYNNSAGGIYLAGSIGSKIYQNTLYNNSGYGIFLQTGLGANVSYNNVYNQSSTGIRADTRENTTEINYNTVHENYGGGIYVGDAYLSNIRFNTVYNTSGIGIHAQSSTYLNITNNTVHNSTNGQPGIRGDSFGLNFSRIETNDLYGVGGIALLVSSTNTTIRDNVILQSSCGVSLQDRVQNTTVFKNTITNVTCVGILVFDYSHDNYILNNTIVNTTGTDGIGMTQGAYGNVAQYNNVSFIYAGAGINVDNATDNTLSYNRIINSTNLGIGLGTYAARNTISLNTVTNTSSDAIQVWALSHNNTVFQNTISFVFSNAYGIRFENTSDNNASYNTLSNTSGYGYGIGIYAFRNRVERNTLTNFSGSKGLSIYGNSSSNYVYLNNFTLGFLAQALDINNASYNNLSYNRISNTTATGVQLIILSTYNTLQDNFVTGQSGSSTFAYYVSNSSFNSLLRNTANFTQAGFSLTAQAYNNTLENNSVYFTPGYGFLVEASSSNNTLRGNVVVNHSADAIRLDTYAADNYVLNNRLINGTNSGPITGYGIRLTGAATRNFVDYNNASFDQANALVISNSTYNTLRYNQFFNSSIQAGYLDTLSNYNSFVGNFFETAAHRVLEVSNASFNTFENNTFRYGSPVQLTTHSTNNTFINNTMEFMQTYSLHVKSQSSNNTFRENDLLNVSGSGSGMLIELGSYDNYFYNNLVSNALGRAVFLNDGGRNQFIGDTYRDTATGDTAHIVMQNSSTDVTFTNVTISSSGGADHFWLNQSSSAVLLNVTFNKSRVTFADASSNVTVRWYVAPYVRTFEGAASIGSSLSVVNTTALNESGVSVAGTAASDGSLARVVLTEFFATGVATNNVSSYNFTANKSGAINSTLLSVTQSGDYVVLLNVPPVVVLSSPLDGLFNRSRTIIFRYVPTDADDVTFLNCSVWTNETAWSIKASNASSITNGSNNTISVTFSSDGFYRWSVGCFDRSAEGALSTANFTIRIDNTTPSGLANGSESALNYSEVNVSFTEANPDSCLLEFNNGTAANYSMNRSGNSCFGNVTILNNGAFNYTVWANDSAGNWNNSVRRFVTLTDDATPPLVSLSSPADSAALSSLSSLVFSFSDAVSSTASCTVYVDGSSVYSNASVLNGTLTSASVSVS